MLTATSGHPGEGPNHMVIRRWTAPFDAAFSITATLKHSEKIGDGVHARIVSSSSGLLGEYTAFNTAASTNIPSVTLRHGDTLDFIVDCHSSITNDSFDWSPIIHSTQPDHPGDWNAAANFSGAQPPAAPPLTPWEKYAQVLLETNEFVFVD
jgi:hypothetical protein